MAPVDPSAAPAVMAVDPGSAKCGLAVVDAQQRVLAREVVPTDQLEKVAAAWMAKYQPVLLLVGNGTGSRAVAERLRQVLDQVLDQVLGQGSGHDVAVLACEEAGTTELARRRYWQAHPPRGLWRLVPTSLRVPPVPVDDWVAVLLAERHWRVEPAGSPQRDAGGR